MIALVVASQIVCLACGWWARSIWGEKFEPTPGVFMASAVPGYSQLFCVVKLNGETITRVYPKAGDWLSREAAHDIADALNRRAARSSLEPAVPSPVPSTETERTS